MNPPSALHGAMSRERKPFSYLPGGLDLSQIKSERMAQRLMRNAMNQGVPEVPVNPIQSPPTPSTPVAVPNYSCLPVQVLPSGFTLPANPKSLLRSRSNPSRESQKAAQAPQFMNTPQSIPQARFEQVHNNINKAEPQIPQTNVHNNRPTSMYEYGYSPNNCTARTSYGSDGNTAQALPEICYEAEYLTTNPTFETEGNNDFPHSIDVEQTAADVKDQLKIDRMANLLDSNANLTYSNKAATTPLHYNNAECEIPAFSEISSTTELGITPISFDNDIKVSSPLTLKNEYTQQEKAIENISVDLEEKNKSNIEEIPTNDLKITIHNPVENKPAEDLSAISDDQKTVKVVKKQVKKEKKIEESATNVEDQNGNQNGDTDAELVVKLPAKKTGTKVETKVEVTKKSLPDGSLEEITKTITKTTTDGKTSIKTKTETRIIPKEEFSEEEVEEEAEEEADEEVKEETNTAVVKQNGHKEITVNKTESTVTTTAKKVVEVQSNDQEEEEEEEEEEEIIEPVKETKVAVKTDEKVEVKQVVAKQEEEEEDIAETQVEVIKQSVPAPEVKPETKQEEQQEEDEEEEEEEEEVEVVKKSEPVENKLAESTQKTGEEEEVDEEEEYEEAEEEVKSDAKKPEPKPDLAESTQKEQDDESEYTEEEIESEPEEAPKQAPKPEPVEKQVPEPEPKPEPNEEKSIPKQEKSEEPVQAAPQPERKVPLREPSIPLEKVEDVEIKPIGEAQTVSRTHTENTEIIRNTTAPAGSLSTQTEYNRVENIVTVNRTTKTLDKAYEQITQSGPPTMKTYFAPNRERVSISPSRPYQPVYTPEPPKTERRHSLLLERLSTERQMPGSEVYQNNYSSQYSNQSINQTYDQQKWSQEPQSEVVNVSNVKPSTISNSQWYQQNRSENVLYNNVTPTTAPPASQLWNQQPPQPQPPQPQPQPQYQPSYTQSTQDYSKVSNTYQQNSYPSYTPQPSSWGNSNLGSVDTIPSINVQSNQSYLSNDTQTYQKSPQQYSSSYVPPPWEQDPNYVAPATASFYQPRTDVHQPPPATSSFSPNTGHPGWTPTLPKTKFSKPPPKAYVPPAPNQSFVKNVNVAEPRPQPGRKTYYSEYERRYITVPESNYVPGESKFQAQPDPSPQYYYDNNEQPAEPVEPQWRKELREFTEKTSQSQYQSQQTSVNPPWESEPNYAKPATPSAKYTPTPSWSQTLRPQSWRERSFESELVSESQEWAKSNTLGRNRPMSSYAKSAEAPAPERPRGVSVDRFNPNHYSGPILSEHQPVQGQTLTPANAPQSKGYHNPNVPAYHARTSAEPREQSNYHHPRTYGQDSRASPLQSRSFKYLQWITGTEE